MEFVSNNIEETIEFGKKLGSLLQANDVILLAGDLGAGKTTLTKGIGQALGITRTINSPTFTIVKEYSGRLKLYHLDLYRLDGLGSDFDLEEYFSSGAVVVCEWPNNVSEILPEEYLKIEIFNIDLNKRRIVVNAFGKRYEQIKEELGC